MNEVFSWQQFEEMLAFYDQWKSGLYEKCDSHNLIRAYVFESEFLLCAAGIIASFAKELKTESSVFHALDMNYINRLNSKQIIEFAEKYVSLKKKEIDQLALNMGYINGVN